MTKLRKPVTRETAATVRDGGERRPIVITLDAGGIHLRQKGRRREYVIPFEAAYEAAAKMVSKMERLEKLRKRGGR